MLSLLLPLLLARPQEPARLEPASTYAVIVGVLEWESESLSPFSKENRRDQALYDRLLALGVPPENMALLLGPEATWEGMGAAVDRIARSAGEGSTFLFYYAGHGYPGSKGIYLASFDAGASEEVPEGYWAGELEHTLSEHFAGERALLLGDCCYSGGLADVALALSEGGLRTASLTSASLANTSTGYWTFTCSLLDALYGRPLLDRNGDGQISLAEAAHDAGEAMTMVEEQASGYSLSGLEPSFVLCDVEGDAAGEVPTPFQLGQYVRLAGEPGARGRRRRGRTARVVDFREGKAGVELQRYSDRELRWVEPERLSALPRPELAKVPAYSKDIFPPLPDPEVAAEQATVGGKYSGLLRSLEVPFDLLENGAFQDYGRWGAKQYRGYTGLPPGYWVYVYPRWYIFEKQADLR